MRKTTDLFQINGKPMLVPDAQVAMRFEDLDAYSAGRDQSGVMHRVLVRQKVGSWDFTYAHLTEEEKNYMESLFGSDAVFTFTHPDRLDSSQKKDTKCYRSNYGISWCNARTGLWSGYSFRIVEC